MANDNCLFCNIAARKIPAKTVFEDDDVIAFEDIKPQAPVHIIIIPRRHIETLEAATEADAAIVGKLVMSARKIARSKGIAASGYRVVINCNKDSGQEIFHIHVHLLGGRRFTWPPG